jgi:hypothetical protein
MRKRTAIVFICVGALATVVGICASTQPGYGHGFRALSGAGIAMIIGGALALRNNRNGKTSVRNRKT